MPHQHRLIWIMLMGLGLIALALLTACQPSQPLTPTEDIQATALSMAQTALFPTPSPTQAFTPILPPTPTTTFTPTPTPPPTETPTPSPEFTSLRFIGVTASYNGVSLIIEIPNLQRVYTLTINGIKYPCQMVDTVPNRLFCNGLAKPPFDQAVRLSLRDPSTDEVVYETTTSIAGNLLKTPAPRGYYDANCPQRGLDVKCEMECRIPPEGGPCVVASCYDSCGLYFSVHTCPEDVEVYPALCTEEQWAEMKARYNIP